MKNKTVINKASMSNATQINDAAVSNISQSTIVNSALFNLSQIPIGTILCNKYRVIADMHVISGEI